MNKPTEIDLDELYNSFFVKVKVTGNKSRRTPIDDYSMSVSASLLDESSRKGLAKITKKLQRLPDKFQSFKLGKRVVVHQSKINDFKTAFDSLEKEFNEFVGSLDLDNLQELHKERTDIEITKDSQYISSVEQVSIPQDKSELHDWFSTSYEMKKLKKDESYLSGIIEKTKEYLTNVEKQIEEKEKILQTKQDLVKHEKDRLQQEINDISERRDKLQEEIEKKFDEGLESREQQHIALIDSQISLQLQDFYLTLQKSLDDFKEKGKINGMKIKSIENKIQDLKKVNEVFKSESVESIVNSLENFPDAFREAQMKLHSESGELPDFDIFEIRFDGYDNVKHQKSLPLVENTMNDLEGFGVDFEQAFKRQKQEREEMSSKTKTESKAEFYCTDCEKKYKSQKSLDNHKKTKTHLKNVEKEPDFTFDPIKT